jgi:hypothetical protein
MDDNAPEENYTGYITAISIGGYSCGIVDHCGSIDEIFYQRKDSKMFHTSNSSKFIKFLVATISKLNTKKQNELKLAGVEIFLDDLLGLCGSKIRIGDGLYQLKGNNVYYSNGHSSRKLKNIRMTIKKILDDLNALDRKELMKNGIVTFAK